MAEQDAVLGDEASVEIRGDTYTTTGDDVTNWTPDPATGSYTVPA